MDCREYQGHISAAVDNVLSNEEMASFDEHGTKCPACRAAYYVESATKSLVGKHAKLIRTPGAVVERIVEQLEREDERAFLAVPRWWFRVTASHYFKPAAALALASVTLVLVLNWPGITSHDSTSGLLNDVIQQSMFNFAAVERGDIKPQILSTHADQLQTFFSGKTEFPVLVPEMKGCDLVGGVVNEHAGSKLAHVVYSRNANIVYIYQACWETVQKGEVLNLPGDVKSELQRSGWYSATRPDGCTLVLWARGNTLCSAVARMPRDELMGYVANGAEPAKW